MRYSDKALRWIQSVIESDAIGRNAFGNLLIAAGSIVTRKFAKAGAILQRSSSGHCRSDTVCGSGARTAETLPSPFDNNFEALLLL